MSHACKHLKDDKEFFQQAAKIKMSRCCSGALRARGNKAMKLHNNNPSSKSLFSPYPVSLPSLFRRER